MSLIPYTITAIERDVADANASGRQIIVGAVCSMTDSNGDVVTLFDDALGGNGSTAKATGANGQVTVYIRQGVYTLTVNGTSSLVTVSDDKTTFVSDFTSLATDIVTKEGDKIVVEDRGNAQYVAQANTYTPIAGDTLDSNGRPLKLIITEGQVFRSQFASEEDALLRLNLEGGGTYFDNTDLPLQRTRKIGVTGTPTVGVSSVSEIQVNNDVVNAKDAIAGEFISQYIDHQFNGGNGGRSGVRVSLVQNGATTNKADVGTPSPFMKAVTGTCAATAPDGGTNGDEYGNIHGALFRAELRNGATDYNAIVGLELNPNIQTGASALRRTGFKVVPEGNSPVKGSLLDNAIGIVNQTNAAKWDYGFTVGDQTGVWPIESDGTIFAALPDGADPITALHGIDLKSVTFTGDAYSSNGFAVDADGVARVEGLVFGEINTPTANNTLDAYDEDVWTPVISFGNNSVGVAYTLQEGDYTQVGNLVFFRVQITLSSKGTSTGVLRINLPPITNPQKITPLANASAFNLVGVSVRDLIPIVNPNGTISLKKGAGVSSQDVLDTDVADNLDIVIAGTYRV